MAKASATSNIPPTKFRPERPIYLNEQNTGFKTKIEVIHAIEQLRDKGFLCCYGEKSRPFHLAFNEEKEFQEFKKTCSALSIVLKSPTIKFDEIEALEVEENEASSMKEAESTASYEDPSGKIHIE